MNLLSYFQTPLSELELEQLLVLFMLATSVALVAIALERGFHLIRLFRSLRAAAGVVDAARTGTLSDAHKLSAGLGGPTRAVFEAGLARALGEVRGDPARTMMREQKRLGGALRAHTWLLATAGALMPFVGLFGTVLGVMSAFEAIGESGQGGFAVVSVGISKALVATAVGIAVALEGVVLFNLLQNIGQKLTRDLSLLVDELLELIESDGRSDAGDTAE